MCQIQYVCNVSTSLSKDVSFTFATSTHLVTVQDSGACYLDTTTSLLKHTIVLPVRQYVVISKAHHRCYVAKHRT